MHAYICIPKYAHTMMTYSSYKYEKLCVLDHPYMYNMG